METRPTLTAAAKGSIPSLPRTGGPFRECHLRIIRHQPDVWNPSQPRLQSDLTVNELVVEADVCRLGPRVGVIDAPQSRPIDCAEAHRAGLAARVDVAVRQVERAQQRAGTANGHNLGMRGRVVVGRDLVPAFRDDCVVADDDCAEWSAAVRAHFLKRKRDRAPHKCLFAHQPIASSNGGMVYSSLNWRWSSHHRSFPSAEISPAGVPSELTGQPWRPRRCQRSSASGRAGPALFSCSWSPPQCVPSRGDRRSSFWEPPMPTLTDGKTIAPTALLAPLIVSSK